MRSSMMQHAERKRIFEIIAIVATFLILIGLSRLETRLFELSETLAHNYDNLTIVAYFALININVILILVFGFLCFRNVVKLVLERRRGVLGSRLRTKLVVALMFFALAPTLLFFYISARFIVTSFDKWFSEKVHTTMQQTREAGAMVYNSDQRRLESLARIALARIDIETKKGDIVFEQLQIDTSRLQGFETEYGLDAIKVFDAAGALSWSSRDEKTEDDGIAVDTYALSALESFKVKPGMVSVSTVEGVGKQDVVKGIAPIYHPISRELLGIVQTETRFETQILKSIEAIQDSFSNLRPGAQLIKLSYLILMIVMTLLIIFSVVWLGFYVARGITEPIKSLAEATREIALGNYSITLTPKTDDEAGQLVRSFNLMTTDLQKHRAEAENAQEGLRQTNEELEERRQYMEIVLKNITAGVISIDQHGNIDSVNDAAERLLKVNAEVAARKNIKEGLGETLYASFWQPFEEKLADRPTFSAQITLTSAGNDLTLLVDAARIYDDSGHELGIIIVFDDADQQVKAQRVAAWREVARRIAHEIKNPVTPIKLSAQRLLRRFNDRFEGEEREIFEFCVETILKQVDSLRNLVNEFSKFARLPSIQTRPGSINQVILDVVGLYKMSYEDVEFDTTELGDVPELPLDMDQMNRVFVNLVTNAIAAIPDETKGKISLSSIYLDDLNTVRVEVCDNGEGIAAEMRDRVLEPYYSTKDDGTGLGLAIVNQIVTDHGGYLRITGNEPAGTRMVIEMPIRTELV